MQHLLAVAALSGLVVGQVSRCGVLSHEGPPPSPLLSAQPGTAGPALGFLKLPLLVALVLFYRWSQRGRTLGALTRGPGEAHAPAIALATAFSAQL